MTILNRGLLVDMCNALQPRTAVAVQLEPILDLIHDIGEIEDPQGLQDEFRKIVYERAPYNGFSDHGFALGLMREQLKEKNCLVDCENAKWERFSERYKDTMIKVAS